MYDEYGDYNGDQGYAAPPAKGNGGDGFAIASLVLGIVSMVLSCLWYIGPIGGVAAITLGIMHKRNGGRSGMATAGIICGIIGILITLLIFAIAFIGIAVLGPELLEQINQAG